MSIVTNNKASTIALSEQMLPVLIAWPQESKDRSGAYMLGGVRQLDPRDLALYLTNRKKFEAMYGATDADAKELRFVIELADAIAARSLSRMRTALTRWIGATEADKEMHWPPGSNTPKRPARFIESLITRFNFRASNAVPIVWWSDGEKRMAFGLFCRDISTALFLLAIEKVGVSSIGRCRGCHGPLIADRPNKEFCDSNCRSRHFMRQLRERQKKALKKGKESQHAKRPRRQN